MKFYVTMPKVDGVELLLPLGPAVQLKPDSIEYRLCTQGEQWMEHPRGVGTVVIL